MSDMERWESRASELDEQWAGKARECPQCRFRFTSRYNRGQCSRCAFIFYASNPIAGDDAHARVPGFPCPIPAMPFRREEEGFDVERLAAISVRAIAGFAASHQQETFYAFAIDANLLCLNSVEAFESCLQHYRKKYPAHYQDEEDVQSLKYNTGDWAYQGFATLWDEDGFNSLLYSEHYDAGAMEDHEAMRTSAYAAAMDRLLAILREQNPFHLLKTTEDFQIRRVEHTY
jgi:hypothetical protein